MFKLGISALLAMAGLGMARSSSVQMRPHTPSKRRRPRMTVRYNEVPRYYPGAKLARKAANGRLGLATLR